MLSIFSSLTMGIFVTLLASNATPWLMLPADINALMLYQVFASAFLLTYLRFHGASLLRQFSWKGADCKLYGIFTLALIGVYCFSVFITNETTTTTAGVSAFITGSLVFGIIIIGPVFEELFYRGLLFDGIAKRRGTAVAALLSSTVFALIHFPQSLTYGFVFFIYGLIFCMLKVNYQSLLYPLLLHMFANMVILFI